MKCIYHYDTPIGRLGIAETADGAVSHILFDKDNRVDNINRADFIKTGFTDYEIRETPAILTAVTQLHEYFNGVRQAFDFPMNPRGTDFQKSVWTALIAIPYGETRTYRAIAEQIGNPKAVRAVGMANNRNPLPIVVPCHRVIGSNGALVGYAGGLDVKRFLIDLEKRDG